MSWTLIPIDFGPRQLVRVWYGQEFCGVLNVTDEAAEDLTAGLVGDPDVDLHDLHPQPGEPAAAPLPAGVEGFAPGRPRTTIVTGQHT